MLDPNGIITNWNAGAERIKGYTAEEIVGQHFSMFYTPEDREAGMPGPRTRNRQARRKIRRRRLAGSQGWDALPRLGRDRRRSTNDGELVGFAKITRDITERQTAQTALHDSERNFRLLVSGVTDYALYMLDPEGIIIELERRRASASRAIAPEEIIGQHFSRFYTDAGPGGRPAGARAEDRRARPAATRRRAGAFARTDRSSGPASSSIRSATKTAS